MLRFLRTLIPSVATGAAILMLLSTSGATRFLPLRESIRRLARLAILIFRS